MRVFISQPMADKTDEEIDMERAIAIKKLKREYTEPIHVIDSFFKGAPHDASPLWYLGESIKLLGMQMLYFSAKGGNSAEDAPLNTNVP